MPTLRAVKNRIASVEKIRKIANALEVVALTRLRRMQQDTIASRDYFDRIRELLFDMVSNINFETHPFLKGAGVSFEGVGSHPKAVRPAEAIGIISVFSDKGLCGDFNANLIKRFLEFCSNYRKEKIKVAIIGKKGLRYLKQKQAYQILSTHSSTDKQTLENGILDIAQSFIEAFLKGEIDEIHLLYSKFRLHLLGEVKVIKLLPFVPDKTESQTEPPKKEQYQRDYLYEPGAYEVFDSLVREYIVNQLHQGILESRCAEEMSRMLAMKSATDNADEMTERLTLLYHKGRQAQITKELTEIISASEA